jgi:hypothetical protein
MDVWGGTGIFKTSELERLYRDVRCAGFQSTAFDARKRFDVTRYRLRAPPSSSR